MQKVRVGIIGATGMVGQRFALLLKDHPWFRVTCLAASSRSAGLTYREAVGKRWAFTSTPIPEYVADMTVMDAADVDAVAAKVDFVFCAVDMKKDEILALEGIVIDITESKVREAQVTYLNDHDFLTGLFNRSYFTKQKQVLSHSDWMPV